MEPDTLKAAMTALSRTQNEEEQALIRAGRFDEVVTRRTQAIQASQAKQTADWQKKLDQSEKDRAETRNRHARLAILGEIQSKIAAKKLDIRPEALPDLEARALRHFRVGDDFSLEGLIVDPNTNKAPTADEWVDGLTSVAPHWFRGGEGGGTRDGKGGGGGTVVLDQNISGEDFTKHAAAIAAGKAVFK
jgi:hypothetical protein